MEQLALDLGLPAAPPETVLSRCNEAAYALVERWPRWPHKIQSVAGPVGSGRSHLARVFADRTGGVLIRGAALDALDPLALAARPVAVDDADAASERALFHLINAAKEAGAGLLLTVRAGHRARLRDLASRLNAAPETLLAAPDDALLRRVMLDDLSRRQLPPNDAVVAFLLQRMERTLHHALALTEALDQEGLAARRGLTRPLAAEVLRRHSSRSPEIVR